MHTCVHVFIIWVHACYEAYVEVRGQLSGVSSLLPSALESWDGTYLGHWLLQQGVFTC